MAIAFAELSGWLPRLSSRIDKDGMTAEADMGRVRISIPTDIAYRIAAGEGRVVFRVVAEFETKPLAGERSRDDESKPTIQTEMQMRGDR